MMDEHCSHNSSGEFGVKVIQNNGKSSFFSPRLRVLMNLMFSIVARVQC